LVVIHPMLKLYAYDFIVRALQENAMKMRVSSRI